MKFISFKVAGVIIGILIASEAFSQQTTKPQESHPQDPLGWLNWMAKASSETAFSGVYIHQYGNRMEASRITHITDSAGEHEKLETLDGPPREIIRHNDDIICHIPEAKLIRLDRKKARKFFPGLLTNVSTLAENYSAKLGGIDRVAGFDCQLIILDPKDSFRFGHRLCAELNSGLLLKALMVKDKLEVLEQFAFTQVTIGALVNRELVKSSYSDKKNVWQTDKSALQDRNIDSGWYVKSPPPGFKKIVEIKRVMSGKTDPAIHQIYSDGLASVSVFIETNTGKDKAPSGLMQQGNYTLYARSLDDQPITVKVLGEVPNISLQQIGNSVVNSKH